MALASSDFVVIEAGALKGVDPQITYHSNRAKAYAWANSRRGLFEQIDVCQVLTRVSIAMVPTETVEGDTP